jgi:hypothetical protein
MSSVDETDNVPIIVTWFGEYPSMNVIQDESTGGRVQYQLSRPPIAASYVWVYKKRTSSKTRQRLLCEFAEISGLSHSKFFTN